MIAESRKIILYIATSLDGYIARANGAIDWLFDDQDYGYTDFYSGVDTLLFGRSTYEQVLTFNEDFVYADKKCYVFSHGIHERNEYVEFINREIPDFVAALKQQPGSNIWLVGGAGLVHDFVRHNLIDEYIISIHPVLIGSGIPLFGHFQQDVKLTLKSMIPYSSGLLQLKYVRQEENQAAYQVQR